MRSVGAPGPDGRRATGGLFSLDGAHPTTVGYGLLAQELITVNGTRRCRIPPRRRVGAAGPGNVTTGLDVLGWADEVAGVFGAALPF
jgi:hypothetical protein